MKHPFFYTYTLFFKVLWIKTLELRNKTIEFLAVRVMFPIAGLIQRKSPGAISIESLLEMDSRSLGYALGCHMKHYRLQFIKGFEEHDMKHLVLGYDVTVPGEIRLSAFEFGAGNRSFMTMGVFFLGIPLAVDLWPQLIKDYRHGKKHKSFRNIPFKKCLSHPFQLMMERTPKKPEWS